jgi:hypothetical protein
LARNGLLGSEKERLCGLVDNPEGILLKVESMRVTTRIVVREKKL